MKKINNTYLTPCTIINLNFNRSVKSKIIKILEKNTREYEHDLELDKSFLDYRK